MLQHLSIKHYALIEHLEIDFDAGLNILTGETGSGKSIIMGALGMLLGERAETRVVQDGKSKCVIEGTFAINGLGVEAFLSENDLDYADHTIIRREILATGSSRAFINDTPVNLKLLREAGMRLLDVHSQHQTLQINDSAFQLRVIDTFAGTRPLLQSYRQAYAFAENARRNLQQALESQHAFESERDYIAFQLKELEEAQLDEIDESEIAETLSMLTHAEEITLRLAAIREVLSEAAQPATDMLRLAADEASKLSHFAKAYAELAERLRSSVIEVDDISREADILLGKVEADPERLATLNALQDGLYRLYRKHNTDGVQALIDLRESFRQQLSKAAFAGEEIETLEKELQQAESELLKLGLALRNARLAAIPELELGVLAILQQLNMKEAAFSINLDALEVPGANGIDGAEMRFSANAGRAPEPVRKVASGGELSRLMLAVKRLSAKATKCNTIVFDEIDTGVSGEVAHSMGGILHEMSTRMQVICITHLPQIAARGGAHYKVFKTIRGGITRTEISRLSQPERVDEIAQMLSGARTTDAALANARELLGATANGV